MATSLADVLLCLPSVPASRQLMHISPQDVLAQLVRFLTYFRGGGDGTKLQILYNKMQDISPGMAQLGSIVQSPPEAEEIVDEDPIHPIPDDSI